MVINLIVPELIEQYVACIEIALPITCTFWVCNLVLSTILTAAFGGKMFFKG